jgi:hypothetical protein
METTMKSKLVPLSLAIAAFGCIGSYAAAGADPNTCIQGFVWRAAQPGDAVCVTPATRDQAASDDAAAASRVDPNGAYGPNSCKQGFVWRNAWDGDAVCVTPATRDQTASDNATAASRVAANAPAAPAPAAPAGQPPAEPCNLGINLPPFITPC